MEEDWEKIGDYIWKNEAESIELLQFTNDDDANVRCAFVRMEHDGQLVSNYFMFDEKNEGPDVKGFALKMVAEFREAEKGKKQDD